MSSCFHVLVSDQDLINGVEAASMGLVLKAVPAEQSLCNRGDSLGSGMADLV